MASILLERHLPLEWALQAPQAPAPDASHNPLLLSLLDNLDEPAMHHAEVEANADLLRVEAKLNVIMQLLGRILQAQANLPPLTAIRFTSDSLAWQVQQPPVPGSLLSLAIYPDPSLPLSIQFLSRVRSIDGDWLEADMHGLSEEQQAIWSRWIFRQHRRQVAQVRSGTDNSVSH